jgi:hypothetical protein
VCERIGYLEAQGLHRRSFVGRRGVGDPREGQQVDEHLPIVTIIISNDNNDNVSLAEQKEMKNWLPAARPCEGTDRW